MTYLDPQKDDHALVFMDYPIRERGDYNPVDRYVECPRCYGHGGWNSKVNQYSLRGLPDTPENRHRYVHFRTSCGNCHGWGYVRRDSKDATCLHEWGMSVNIGRCLHEYTCNKCGAKRQVDSSD